MVVMAVLAVATPVTQLAQEAGWSFRTYAIGLALLSVTTAAAVCRAELRGGVAALRAQPGGALTLALAAAAAALVALVSHRPRWDDFSYIPNVVHFVAHPEAAMGHVVQFVYGGRSAIESYYVGTSMPFEYAQGVVAYGLGLHVLSVYHVIGPALFAALVPLVWYYAISRFEFSDRAAIAGALLICLCLLLMGESHRGFGSYSFTRLWHGKVVVMALGLPLVAGLAIDFFRTPRAGTWLRLFLVATALVGASTSSIVLLTLLAPVLALASVVAFLPPLRSAVLHGLAFGASFVYVAVFGVAFLVVAASELGASDPVHEGFATTFFGQLQYVFPWRTPTVTFAPALALASGAGALLLLRGWQRRFFATWLVTVVAGYLNPWVAPWLIDHVAPTGVYWRLFYLLPFPLAIGLTGAWLAERAGTGAPARALATLVIGIAVAAHLPARSPSIFRYYTTLGVGYQIERADRPTAEWIVEVSPPGPMLAPWYLGALVTILSADRPQVTTRDAALGVWFTSRGHAGEAELRREASEYLDGASRRGREAVLELALRHPEIQSVIARRPAAAQPKLIEGLRARGFTDRRSFGELEMFARPGQGQSQRGLSR
jgi:hypothetical protein